MLDRRTRVLIVEDDDATRHSLTEWLQSEGHECVGAASTGETYRRCQKERFDCMVLDAQFDRTPGLALAERLSDSPRRPSRILVVTGHPPEDFDAALRNGLVDGYLRKPVDPRAIGEFVARSAP